MTRVVRRRVATVVGLVVITAVSAGCVGGGGAVQPRTPAVGPARVSGPTVVAVGDIACAPGEQVTATKCQMAQTGRLTERLKPRVVLVLGDFQYGLDTLHSPRVYDRTWGRLKSITRPIPGNHEYETEGARTYYRYFRDQTPEHPGYYAYDVAGWRIYALNARCRSLDCDTEARWLDQDMTAHPRDCSLIATHEPRYSSGGRHGGTEVVAPFWRVALRHHGDLAVAGHEHNYERFDPMDASAHRDPNGIRSFVAGTGGKNLYGFTTPQPGSILRDAKDFGVLALTLGDDAYAWRFLTIDGATIDSGTSYCHR
jgi:acid phosphatase type 7